MVVKKSKKVKKFNLLEPLFFLYFPKIDIRINNHSISNFWDLKFEQSNLYRLRQMQIQEKKEFQFNSFCLIKVLNKNGRDSLIRESNFLLGLSRNLQFADLVHKG